MPFSILPEEQGLTKGIRSIQLPKGPIKVTEQRVGGPPEFGPPKQEVQVVEDPELLKRIRSYGVYDLLAALGKRLGRTVDIEELKSRPELSEQELEKIMYTSILSGISPGPKVVGGIQKAVEGIKIVDKAMQKLPPVSTTGKGFEAARQ